MAKCPRKKAKQLARKFRCTIDKTRHGNYDHIVIYAPPKHVFSLGRSHFVIHYHHRAFSINEAWQALAYRLQHGVEKCKEKHCDVCTKNTGVQGAKRHP